MSVSPGQDPSDHEQTPAACGPSRDSIDQLDRLLLEQTLEGQRASTASITSAGTALVVVLVTLVGFAVERKSWGLALVGALVYPTAVRRFRAHSKTTELFLDSAVAMEKRLRGSSPDVSVVADMRAAWSLGQHVEVVIWLTMLVHVAVTIVLIVWVDDFTFAGS
jgi:hypothetical protein